MDGLNTPDAVAQARMHVEMYRNPMAFSDDEFAEYVDALIAAVRADCAAKVEALPVSYAIGGTTTFGPLLDRAKTLAAITEAQP